MQAKRFLGSVVVIAAVGACSSAAPPPVAPQPPPQQPAPAAEAAYDPPAPTLRLPRHFMPSHVAARLAIDPAQPTFDGEVTIAGTLDRRAAVIWMYGGVLEVAAATATNGNVTIPLAAKADHDLLELRPAQPLDAGAWTLHIGYRGKLVENGYQGAFLNKQGDDRFITTQFESTAARLVFPCFDEPDFKVPWQLALDVPTGQVAVSNTPIASESPIDAAHRRVTFAETRPLPSYLVAFTVGPYDIVDAGHAHSGLALRVLAPRGKAKEAAYLASALPRIVDILEAWFAIPYPYPKLDIVAVPSARGLAMENAGMITADARYTLLSNPAPLDEYNLVSVIGHETAHQWFGDLVTATWWDDIWLNESFATWMEDKILAAFDPAWPSEVMQHRQAAFDADELLTARKIHQPIDTLDAIHNIFDSITYPKGALVLRMLEHEVGEAAFQTAIRGYLAAHADRNAKAADVFAAIEAAGKPLGALVTGYFERAGVPDVAMRLACEGGVAKVTLSQRRYVPVVDVARTDDPWVVPVCVAYGDPQHKRAEACTQLAAPTGEVALDRCPTWFAPAGDVGYYRVDLEPSALEAIRDRAWPALTSNERIAIFSHAMAHARTGSPSTQLLMDLAAKLRVAPDPQAFVDSLGAPYASSYTQPTGLPESFESELPGDLVAAARARVRAAVEPTAQRLGLLPRANDTYATALERDDAVSAAIWSRSHVLDAQAKQAFAKFRELPSASRTNVTRLAANADPAVAAQLRAQLATEPDRVNRDAIVRGLGAVADPARHRAIADALLDAPSTTGEDVIRFLFAGGEQARAANAAWVVDHVDRVLAKLPVLADDDFPLAVSLVYLMLERCDPAHRDDYAALVRDHFGTMPGAQLTIKQVTERNEQCLAQKKLLEPSLRAWLGKP